MDINLLGLACVCPAGRVTQQEALTLTAARSALTPARANLLKRLYLNSTVRQRASVLIREGGNGESVRDIDRFYEQPGDGNGHGPTVSQRMKRYESEALPLAARAARQTIESAGIHPQDIRQVVTVSCTGLSSPGLDIGLIRELGLPASTGRTTIGFMGCHGAINGLRVASALAHQSPGEPVLLCAVELCTLHFHYGWDQGRVVANGLFADGAATVLLRAAQNDAACQQGWRVRDTGSCLLPDSTGDMAWVIGDFGFEMTLSNRVPDLIRQNLRSWLTNWLRERGKTLKDIGAWAIHPGGPKVIDAVRDALGLTDEDTRASRDILAEHGNMSSPTVLFILQNLTQRGAAGPCVMLAFGPGLVVEAALLE